MKYFPVLLALLFILFGLGCNSSSNQEQAPSESGITDTISAETPGPAQIDSRQIEEIIEEPTSPDTSELEQTLIDQGLVSVLRAIPDARLDVKYSTEDNFMSEDMYGDYAGCYLQGEVVEMLAHAQEYIHEDHPQLHLLIFDCVRPRSVQYKMWELVKGTDKENYVAPPKSGSVRNYGAAVDLGLIHTDSGEVDMGTAYDYFGLLAQPRHELNFVKTGELSQAQVDNRRILRAAMLKAGFHGILSEWWHFNAFDRKEVRKKFKVVE